MSESSPAMAPAPVRRLRTIATAMVAIVIGLVVYAVGVRHALETATPLLRADGWWFVEAWLMPWQDGTFTLADLWAKRHGNHAQPITAALFLLNAEWFGLDFAIETLIGIGFATVYCALLLTMIWRTSGRRDARELAWAGCALVCILFSINSSEKLSWSLVALFYMGHILGLAMLVLVARESPLRKPQWLLLASFVMCVLLDTTGILWCLAAAGVLIVVRFERTRLHWRARAASVLSIIVGIVLYQIGYAIFAPPQAGPPSPSILEAMRAISGGIGVLWYGLMPPGAAMLHPNRIDVLLGKDDHVGIVLALSAICLSAHLWLGAMLLRKRVDTGFAVAAGLAFFAYLTLVGMLLQRVPFFGFEYLLQPRYGVFFDLFWIAPVLAWSSRPDRSESRMLRLGARAVLLIPIVIAVLLFGVARKEVPWVRGWNDWIARDTWALMRDPAQPPANCNPNLMLCGLPLEVRENVVRTLEAGPYNIASPRFRAEHGLDALLRETRVAEPEAERKPEAEIGTNPGD